MELHVVLESARCSDDVCGQFHMRSAKIKIFEKVFHYETIPFAVL